MSIEFEQHGAVAWVTLNRPEVRNAINQQMRADLQQIFEEVERNPDIRVSVLTGAGERTFCAGTDLKEPTTYVEGAFLQNHLNADTWAVTDPLDKLTKPIIAAVNGHAFGGGMELALACDLRICSENAEFALTEVRFGSMPGSGGTQRLIEAVPSAVAMKMLLTGCRLDAQEAYRVGLVSDVTSLATLHQLADELATQIAANAPLATRATKIAALHARGMSLQQGLLWERLWFGHVRGTEDRQEGRRAFREGRNPDFTGE